MGALGHRSAVAEIMGVKMLGFLAWLLWRAIYLMKLPGLDRKIRVTTDWFFDLLLPPDIVQLKTGPSVAVRREHFEPGTRPSARSFRIFRRSKGSWRR